MKAFSIPAGLLAVILGFSLWTGRYVSLRTDHWTALLEKTEETAFAGDWEDAERRLQEAYADWNTSQMFFHTIMDHSELDEADTLFVGAMAVCALQDDADFHLQLAQLQEQLRLLAETQSISIQNIL